MPTPNLSKVKQSVPSSSLLQKHLLEGSVNKKTCARMAQHDHAELRCRKEFPIWRVTGKPEVIDHEERFFFHFLICGLSVWKTRITGSDPVRNSSRSERTRTIKTPCAYLIFSHTGGEDDGTGSTTRRYVLWFLPENASKAFHAASSNTHRRKFRSAR